MRSSFPRIAVLCVVLSLIGSATVPAQSPPLPGTTAATPSTTPAEVIAPVPTHWFSDYAKATSPNFAIDLDRRLERFEHKTTNQFIVVIFPKMQSAAPLDDYCLRAFRAWGVGQKGVNNGVVLFIFVQDHKVRIQVGRGLETPLTNPVCQDIIQQMLPSFRSSDIEGGVTTCVDAVITILKTQPPTPRPAP